MSALPSHQKLDHTPASLYCGQAFLHLFDNLASPDSNQSQRLGGDVIFGRCVIEKRSTLRIFPIGQMINEFVYEDDFPAGIWSHR